MMFSRFKAQIIAAGVAILGFLALLGKAKRDGKKELRNEIKQDTQERVEKAKQAVDDGRASGRSNDDRMRSNDDAWGSGL